MSANDFRTWRHVAATLILALLAACSTTPAERAPMARAPVFYPAAPDLPRIQHLKSFTGESDFAANRSAFAQFIAGDAKGQEMQQVYGVALFDGTLYAVDTKAAAIAEFNLVKQQFSLFAGSGGGRMKSPINLTIDADGTKYVTDTARNQVLLYDRDNRYLGAYGEPGQFRPVGWGRGGGDWNSLGFGNRSQDTAVFDQTKCMTQFIN